MKARITRIPVRFSRVTRFRLSVRRCITLNFGETRSMMVIIAPSSATTAAATAAVHCHCFPEILTMPQAAVMGALIIICRPMVSSI